VTLAVHEWGSRGDVPFVFWHALGDGQSGAHFARVGKVLAGAGFHVLAVDGPGFGRSRLLPADDYSLVSLAGHLHEVLDEREVDRPVVSGHSWGGGVALHYAALQPENVRALVLFDSGHIDYRDVEDVDSLGLSDDARGRALRGLLDRVSPCWDVVHDHEIPTLLFLATEPPHGEQNRAHVGAFQAAIPHAEVRWPPGSTHGILDDVGPPLGEEIAAWLVDQGL